MDFILFYIKIALRARLIFDIFGKCSFIVW